jgi:hypothetical protein
MKRDIQLIGLFLGKYRDSNGDSYTIVERPEKVERNKPAVEAIAVNRNGRRLAIEHTFVEPFEGQMADNPRFLAAFGRLHQATELRVSGMLIDLLIEVGAIPNGFDWNLVGQAVLEWFKSIRTTLREGASDHSIPSLGFDLIVHVEALEISGDVGVVVASRIWPKDRPFRNVLLRALEEKLPKLVAT